MLINKLSLSVVLIQHELNLDTVKELCCIHHRRQNGSLVVRWNAAEWSFYVNRLVFIIPEGHNLFWRTSRSDLNLHYLRMLV